MKIFNEFGNWWLPDDVCKELGCHILINNCDNKYNAGSGTIAGGGIGPLRINRCPDHYYSNMKKRTDRRESHPITGQRKQNYKELKARQLGGKCGEPGWQDKLDEAQHLWNIEIKNHLLNTAIADKVTPSISPEREFGPYLPMTSYKSTERIGMEVEDGDVYVVQNPLTPDIQKVGKTSPNGIAAILAAARRFGPAILIYKQWFPLAFEAEQAVHKILEPYNLRKLRGPNPETGLYDCGIELFECSVETVLKAIEEVSIDTRQKQKMD